ncbi:asparagine synthetase domain-containing protein 1-like isoform X2 [Antedon mediterranea]
MCGISCVIGSSLETLSLEIADLRELLKRRGPDYSSEKCINLSAESLHAIFFGCVLHFRGKLTAQPLQDLHQNVLLWNGEIFAGIKVKNDENDGNVLLKLLEQCSSDLEITSQLSQIQGPCSLIYWQASRKRLWFGRDAVGRRSLLWGNKNNHFLLSSVSKRPLNDSDTVWSEVPANGIYCLDCQHWPSTNEDKFKINLFPWQNVPLISIPSTDGLGYQTDHVAIEIDNFGSEYLQTVPSERKDLVVNHIESSKSHHLYVNNHICLNISNIHIQNFIPNLTKDLPTMEQLMKYNLTEEFKKEMKELPPNLENKQDLDNLSSEQTFKFLNHLLQSDVESKSIALSFIEVLGDAVRRRVFNVPRDVVMDYCPKTINHSSKKETISDDEKTMKYSVVHASLNKDSLNTAIVSGSALQSRGAVKCSTTLEDNCFEKFKYSEVECSNTTQCTKTEDFAEYSGTDQSAKVAILFSGGIDSMVIAALADRYVPISETIDLINVAFQQQIKSDSAERQTSSFDVPDRITGLAGLQELQNLNPDRHWNFLEVNVTYEELQSMRSSRISDLVYPHNTVLDDSIGCAIWFAARGQDKNFYTSPSKVVLVGMGADEQLAGYSRHRTRFRYM